MTTFHAEPQTHGVTFDDPAFLDTVAGSPELFAAFEHFNETRARLDPTFTPLVLDIPRSVITQTAKTHVAVVTAPPYEYDVNTTAVFEPPSEDDLSERDFFNPEESLLPELFATNVIPELFVPSTIPDTLAVAESEGLALPDQPQVPSIPHPVDEPDIHLVSGPPMIFPLEFKVPDNFDESKADDQAEEIERVVPGLPRLSEEQVFDVMRQTVPEAFTRPENFREAPEPPQFTVSPEPVVRSDILVPMLAVPTPVSDQNVKEPRGRRNRSVATLLDDDETVEATSNVVPEVRYAESLYATEAVDSPAIEVLDEATVAVDAKKSRFARKSRSKEPKVPKVKLEKTPKPPKGAAPVVEGKPVSKNARKVKVGKQAKKTKSGEDADEKTTKPISEGQRKRLVFTAAAVGFMIVFVLVGGFVGAKALGLEPSAVNTSKLSPALNDTDMVMSKQAPMSSFNKGDLVVVRHPDSTLGYGIFYSAETTETIRMYNNVDLKPAEVAVDTLSRPVVTIPSVGTEVTVALNTPVPGILTVAALAGVVGSVMLRRKA